MSEKRDIKYFKNPHGDLTEEEMINMIIEDKADEFIRKHNLTKDKCPPIHLRNLGEIGQCFYCANDCLKAAFKKVEKKYNKRIEAEKKVNKGEIE